MLGEGQKGGREGFKDALSNNQGDAKNPIPPLLWDKGGLRGTRFFSELGIFMAWEVLRSEDINLLKAAPFLHRLNASSKEPRNGI